MRRWVIVFAVLAALFSAVRHFPLSWAMGAAPAGLGAPSGTIWNGQISDVPLFGRLYVKAGLGHVDVGSPPGETTLRGRLRPGAVQDLSVSMPIAALPIPDQRLQGIGGRVSLRIESATYEDLLCLEASGTAATNVLAVNARTLGWTGPNLSGPVDCVDGRVRVQLSGVDAMAEISATVLMGGDGFYQSDITARVNDPNAGSVLGLFGFSAVSANEYRL